MKPFLSINEQINHLQKDKNIKCDQSDKIELIKRGYFNLVNGYKHPFVIKMNDRGNHIYESGTTLTDLEHLMDFDDKLSFLFFKTLTKVEQEVRTISAYLIEKHNDGKFYWDNTTSYGNYDSEKQNIDICSLVVSLKKEIDESKDKPYLSNYSNKEDENYPMWIVTKAIEFKTFITLLRYSNDNVIKDLCDIYGIENTERTKAKDYLLSFLSWIRKVRNVCVHNERLYNYYGKGRIKETIIENTFGSRYSKYREAKYLFDLLVYLCYFLSSDEYCLLIDNLLIIIKEYKDVAGKELFKKIRKEMGIHDLNDLCNCQ